MNYGSESGSESSSDSESGSGAGFGVGSSIKWNKKVKQSKMANFLEHNAAFEIGKVRFFTICFG
jgi:hypothetical protein